MLSTCCTNQPPDLTSFLNLAFFFAKLEGKMKCYLILSLICYFYQSTSTEIKLESKKNILNFGYGINYKYEGMLAHSFDSFYVVTNLYYLPLEILQFSKLNYDNTCTYLDNKNTHSTETRKHMLDLMTFCKKIEPFVIYYKRLIKSYNNNSS